MPKRRMSAEEVVAFVHEAVPYAKRDDTEVDPEVALALAEKTRERAMETLRTKRTPRATPPTRDVETQLLGELAQAAARIEQIAGKRGGVALYRLSRHAGDQVAYLEPRQKDIQSRRETMFGVAQPQIERGHLNTPELTQVREDIQRPSNDQLELLKEKFNTRRHA